MNRSSSPLWLSPPEDLDARLERVLEEALRSSGSNEARVFFRADDIGVPGPQFTRLMEIFAKHRAPLSLAVVPVWLTEARWRAIQDRVDHLGAKYPIAGEGAQKAKAIWCWHQHGWRHQNHEPSGKKQEFGPSRPAVEMEKDLRRGRDRLVSIMGKDFFPAFTPPWNRCCAEALGILKRMGCKAVSRSRGEPPAPPGLPDFSVNVDLHTRKETDPNAGWEALFSELRQTLAGGFCGVMIHHQRMNEAAFDFLERLLDKTTRFKELRAVHLLELVDLAGDLGDLAESAPTPKR